jgi:hypothetical protein
VEVEKVKGTEEYGGQKKGRGEQKRLTLLRSEQVLS